jgi:RNA polymerase sigma-70 factor (ECF subfamily)
MTSDETAHSPDLPACSESEPSDAELMVQAQASSDRAFKELFGRHYAAVRALAARILCDLSAAEDVAQETFVRFARELSAIKEPSGLRSWLFRVAANLCRDYLRSRTRRNYREGDYADLCLQAEPGRNPAATGVASALAKLPPQEREAIVLVYYENLSHPAAARIAGCAPSTISWRIMLAKRKLKSLLIE